RPGRAACENAGRRIPPPGARCRSRAAARHRHTASATNWPVRQSGSPGRGRFPHRRGTAAAAAAGDTGSWVRLSRSQHRSPAPRGLQFGLCPGGKRFMQLSPSIFKAYDIRGVVPAALNEEVAQALGLAFGKAAQAEGEKVVAVGRDGRLSGPALSGALVRGLITSGVDVIDIGPATTPMLYFAASTLCSSGIQVTGSHNPKDYNGFKMVLAGRAIHGEEIQALRRSMAAPGKTAAPPGHVRNINVLAPYRDR